MEAHLAHNQEYAGSSPVSAIQKKSKNINKKAGDILNIILNDNTIRTTKFNKEETYELSDINIYIPNDQKHTNAYIILKNQQGIYDIIPIELVEKTTTHKRYKITYTNPIRIPSGEIEIKVLLLDIENNYSCIISDNLICNINIDNYRIAYQTVISEQLGNSIKTMYEKINQLTEMNINIYEEMKGE